MSDSANQPETPIERPKWRFSGRRGTPVHLREKAAATTSAPLPREIRQVIVDMTRSRAKTHPESHDADTAASPTANAVPMPPVAGAPQPVERRAPRIDDVPVSAVTAHVPPASPPEPVVEAVAEIEIPAASTIEYPPATAAKEAGEQSAWELGRLPILLDAAESQTPEAPEALEPPEIEVPEPATPRWTGKRTRGTSSPEHVPVELHPVEWLPVGPDPQPAPIDGVEIPETAVPTEIARLKQRFHVRSTLPTVEDGRPRSASTRTAHARHQVLRRREDLGGLVEMLGDLAGTKRG